MSIAGGVSRAVDRALVHGCEALQIFAKNANQWRGKPLDPADVRTFRLRIEQTGITPVVSHASYLINLATTFSMLREQSIDSGKPRRAPAKPRPASGRRSRGRKTAPAR